MNSVVSQILHVAEFQVFGRSFIFGSLSVSTKV